MKQTIILILLVALYGCRWVETKEEQKSKELKNMKAPEIKKVTYIHADDFDSRKDEYQWMVTEPRNLLDSNNSEFKEIRSYLIAENEYAHAKLYENQGLKSQILAEIEGFGNPNQIFHYKIGDYRYYSEFSKNDPFPIIYRYPEAEPEKVKQIIDFNEMSKEFSNFKLGEFKISPNHQYLAYSIDTSGTEKYLIRIFEIPKNLTQTTSIQNSDGQLIWGNDSKSIFLVETIKKGSSRSSSIYQYKFLESSNKKNLVLMDKKSSVKWELQKSKSGRFIFIYKRDNTTTTTYFIDLQKNQSPNLFRETEIGNSYFLGHQKNSFIIRTNRESSPNFKVYKSQISQYQDASKWEVLVGHREDAVVEGMSIFESFIVLEEKVDGIKNFHILNSETGMGHYVDINEETYSAQLKYNYDYFATNFIYEYSSFSTPKTVYQYSSETRERERLYQSNLKNDFEENEYKTERIWATSFDGTRVPISLIYKRTTKLDGTAPLFLRYEANFGNTIDLEFDPKLFSLINRGFICAVAHLRGGGYLGEKWHQESVGLKKSKSVYDLIYAINHLSDQDYSSKDQVFISAKNSNATIITSALNLRPNLAKGLVLFNPKTDLLTSLFLEKNNFKQSFSEWGDPHNEKNYFSIKSISPYDQIRKGDYPSILIQNDLINLGSPFWESAKYVARLRENSIGDSKIIMETELEQIGKQSAKIENEKVAKSFSFILSLMN